MQNTNCRYFKDLWNGISLCTKENVKEPRCEDCDVDPAPDGIYNDAQFVRLCRDTSPHGAEQMYKFVQRLVKEGVVDVKSTRR